MDECERVLSLSFSLSLAFLTCSVFCCVKCEWANKVAWSHALPFCARLSRIGQEHRAKGIPGREYIKVLIEVLSLERG